MYFRPLSRIKLGMVIGEHGMVFGEHGVNLCLGRNPYLKKTPKGYACPHMYFHRLRGFVLHKQQVENVEYCWTSLVRTHIPFVFKTTIKVLNCEYLLLK